MNKKDIAKQVAALGEQFKADSLYSIDYGRNAKAIAFASDDVKTKIAEIIAQGYVISAVRPIAGFGSSVLNFKLAVEFESTGQQAAIVKKNKALILTIEIPSRRVTKVLEANSLVSDLPVTTPFATINPNPDADVRTPLSELRGKRDVEARYFRSLGIPGGGISDPMDPTNPPGQRGPVIINPGGPFGAGPRWPSVGVIRNPDTDVETGTGCETESDGIADDSGYDDWKNDGTVPDDARPEMGRLFF